MPTIYVEDFASRITHYLRLEGVAFLLARIDALLPPVVRGARDRRLETIDQETVNLLHLQVGSFTPKAFLGLEAVGRKQLPQQRHDLVKEILAGVSTDTEQVSDDFMCHVMSQRGRAPTRLLVPQRVCV